MPDDSIARQLNEAVIPQKFSLDAAATQKFTLEGWSHDDALNANLARDLKRPAKLKSEAEEWDSAWQHSAALDSLSHGTLPLASEGNTEFGLSFGKGGMGGNNDDGRYDRFRSGNDDGRFDHLRTGKVVGLYMNMEF